ncbi:fimbrial protein [Pseudescherichia vulneris]
MKLNKFVVAMGLGVTLFSGMTMAAGENNGTITFTGSIATSPCSIKDDQLNQTIPMGQISNKVLDKGGKSSPEAFTIQLIDCIVAETDDAVSITFSGTVADSNKDNFALLGGTAKGASLAIVDEKANPVKFGAKTPLKTLAKGTNDLNFSAYLVGDASGTIVPGEFTVPANFVLTYE